MYFYYGFINENEMGNPLWKAGMKAVNPEGRPKRSVRTPQAMLERFIKGNVGDH